MPRTITITQAKLTTIVINIDARTMTAGYTLATAEGVPVAQGFVEFVAEMPTTPDIPGNERTRVLLTPQQLGAVTSLVNAVRNEVQKQVDPPAAPAGSGK